MPHDSTVSRGVAEWFERVDDDLQAADILLSAESPIIRNALFNLQQAAEKAMKAFLVGHSVNFRLTHSLEEIGEACREIDPTLFPMIYPTLPLTEFATVARYPGPVEIPDLETVRELFASVQALVEAIKARLAEGGK